MKAEIVLESEINWHLKSFNEIEDGSLFRVGPDKDLGLKLSPTAYLIFKPWFYYYNGKGHNFNVYPLNGTITIKSL